MKILADRFDMVGRSGSGEAMGLEINHAQLGSQEGGGQLNHV